MMTPEQRIQLDDLIGRVEDAAYDVNVDIGKVKMAGDDIVAYVDSLLAAERAAVVEECANVCKRLAEAMEQGAGELAPGGRLRQAENTIRDLGEKRE